MAEDEFLSRDSQHGLSNDDIVPGVYEGGFKTWECSMDLAQYVAETESVAVVSTFWRLSLSWLRIRSGANFPKHHITA